MGEHQREGGIVADGTYIAEVIGEPLQFGHQRPEPDSPRRHRHLQRCLDGASEGKGIGDGRITGRAAGKLCAARDVGTGHQPVDPLVDVTQPLFQPHDGLARGSKAEMSRLDDAGMDRTNRDLVEALTFDGQEPIGRRRNRLLRGRIGLCRQGAADIPAAVVEPRARVGQPLRCQSIEVSHRAFETDGRRVAGADARETAASGGQADDGQAVNVGDRHVHHVRLAPFADERQFAGGERRDGCAPGVGIDHDPHPRPVARDRCSASGEGVARGHPSSLAICSNQTTSIGGM